MLSTVLQVATSTVVLCAAAFVAGVVLSQKVKDYVANVPSGFRNAMNSVEAKAKADVQSAIADVFAKINPAPVAPPAAPAPVAPKV